MSDMNNNAVLSSAVTSPYINFAVTLGELVRHGCMLVRLTTPQGPVGEIDVKLERTSTNISSVEYPQQASGISSISKVTGSGVSDGTTFPGDAQIASSSSAALSNSLDCFIGNIDETVGVATEKFRITARDQLQFLVQQFSKPRKRRRKVVRRELIAFKKAILRDYNNRAMKFQVKFDNYRQVVPPEELIQSTKHRTHHTPVTNAFHVVNETEHKHPIKSPKLQRRLVLKSSLHFFNCFFIFQFSTNFATKCTRIIVLFFIQGKKD